MNNKCTKTILASAIAVAVTAQANDVNINAYSTQATLPEAGTFDGFIIYLKDEANANNMSIQSVENSIATVAGAQVDRRLATGGLVIKSAEDLGLFAHSAAGVSYQAKKDVEIFEELRNHPSVALVEPNLIMQHTMVPNDTEYDRLWGLNSAQYGINVESTWDTYKGNGVNVAVIDTGIVNHSDLNGNVVAGYDFISDSFNANDGNGRDSNPADAGDYTYAGECGRTRDTPSSWHGSHVAGTIAGVANNFRGVSGVAPEANIIPIRVLGKCGGSSADIADAIVWASGGSVSGVPTNNNPADVINMSLGGSGACSYTYQNAINAAVRNGSTVVVAAGNSNSNVRGFTPASCSNVIAVAALGATGNRASYSNYGEGIDVAAPGGDQRNGGERNGIYSTVDRGTTRPIGEGYAYYDGTSMAAPHVAGVAALVKDKYPNYTPAQVKQAIINGVRPIPGSCYEGCGEGIVDVGRTLGGSVTPPPPPSGDEVVLSDYVSSGASATTDGFTVTSGTISGTLTFTSSSANLDLYLQKKSSYSDTWYNVASSRNYGSQSESVSYRVYSEGTYRWGVKSVYGSTYATLRYKTK